MWAQNSLNVYIILYNNKMIPKCINYYIKKKKNTSLTATVGKYR